MYTYSRGEIFIITGACIKQDQKGTKKREDFNIYNRNNKIAQLRKKLTDHLPRSNSIRFPKAACMRKPVGSAGRPTKRWE